MPVVSFFIESLFPLALEELQVEIWCERGAVNERVPGQRGDGFVLAIFQHNFDLWSGRPEVGVSLFGRTMRPRIEGAAALADVLLGRGSEELAQSNQERN